MPAKRDPLLTARGTRYTYLGWLRAMNKLSPNMPVGYAQREALRRAYPDYEQRRAKEREKESHSDDAFWRAVRAHEATPAYRRTVRHENATHARLDRKTRQRRQSAYRASRRQPAKPAKPRKSTLRLSIRKHTYHGENGYLLSGNGPGVYGTKIFTRTRVEAERMREQIRRGEEPTFDKR